MLAKNDDPALLSDLRAQCLDSLVEMARWHNPGHAFEYRELLGKLAGFDEQQIHKPIMGGDVDQLVAAAEQSVSPQLHSRRPAH